MLHSSAKQVLLCCSRQSGKTHTVAAVTLNQALLKRKSLCLVLSPTERQSKEFIDLVKSYYHGLHEPVETRKETELQLHLENGSRIIGLPENERGIRGYSGARLLVIDEAARVSDALYGAIRPMLAVSGGRLIALSTPFGKRGWYFDEWDHGNDWERYAITADQCPRITPEFLAEERLKGERYFAQEFGCSFEAAADAVFDPSLVRSSLKSGDVLFG